MTKEEEEKRIIEMFQERYTYPQIAKELHKSITTIKDVKDRYDNSLLLKDKPKASDIYSLFRQGKDCFEISQEFGLDAKETKKYFEDYLDICGLQEFRDLYHELGLLLRDVLTFYKNMRSRGYSIDELVNFKELPLKILALQGELIRRTAECNQLKKLGNALSFEKRKLQNEVLDLAIKKANLERRVKELYEKCAFLGPGLGHKDSY
jgi:cell fate (sporulation/competence/biofilm development) regulator YlbF (YheA/YmcA/DUF963 family)